MSCESCDQWRREYRYLESQMRELQQELKEARTKADNYDSIKRERDELKKSVERSYDKWVTDPGR